MTREKSLEAMLALVFGCLLLSLLLDIKLLLYVGLLLGGIGLLMAKTSRALARLWYKLSQALGFVISKVLLSLVFFVFLLPMALLSRVFRPDLLQRRRKNTGSYFVVRNYSYQSKDLKNPW
ncbi:MAG TPA: hypothetical protein PKY55_04685 [bacterium]|jgi:hypothetical protein|nr:hypothetical protein [bacterium]HOY43816.1 hypothetical protein [bacterium]HPG82549.1 hypothetical protein [bacterium]HPM58401.1 hypothetical protein [bacterium]